MCNHRGVLRDVFVHTYRVDLAVVSGMKKLADRAQYRERVRVQTLKWAMGSPYHNKIDDECCPDFSCCKPEMFDKNALNRWSYYRKHFGKD